MGEHYDVLIAPDPELLLDLFSPELFGKVIACNLCLVVDDDGTISDSFPAYTDWLSRKLKRPIRVGESKRYDFLDIDPQALGMLQASVFGNARFHRDLPLVVGAAEALNELRALGVPVIILTARPPVRSIVTATYNHKIKNGVPFDLLIFSKRKREIIKAVSRLRCQIAVVDDDPAVAKRVHRLKGIEMLLFNAYYNEDLNWTGIQRVFSWSEVVKLVGDLQTNRSGS